MTHEQNNSIERLSLQHGSVCVHPGRWGNGQIRVTVPDGSCFSVMPTGSLKEAPFNHGVDWNA